jgi:hypothetical protein
MMQIELTELPESSLLTAANQRGGVESGLGAEATELTSETLLEGSLKWIPSTAST